MPKNARLLRLSLTNYRNIEHAELDFSGRNSAIVGENHVGKTNTLESLFVLLDDSLLNGSSNLPSIKPLADTKRVTSIEATFDVDGEEFAVRKDYGEDWVRARGTDTLTMKGHFQTLYIQGTKIERTKDFYAQIREKFGIPADSNDKIDYVRMLLAPNYLGDMGEGKDWTALRAFVIKLVGDVSDADVFAANPQLAIIEPELKAQNGSVDNLKRKLKQECDCLEITITQKEAIVSSLEKTERPTDDDVAIAKRAIEEIDSAIAALRSGNGTDVASEEIQRKLSDAQADLIAEHARAAKEYVDPYAAKREELRNRHAANVKHMDDCVREKSSATQEIYNCSVRINSLERERANYDNEKMVERIRELRDAEIEVVDTCPLCGQPLPTEKVESAIEKAKEKRDAEISDLTAKCKANKAKRAEIDQKIIDEKKAVADFQDKVEFFEKEIEETNKNYDAICEEAKALPERGEIAETEREKELRARAESLNEQLKQSRSAFQAGLQDTNAQIAAKQDEKTPYQKVLDDLAYYERQKAKLATERDELSAKKKELATAEQKRECAVQFLYAKLKLLDENVSKVFGKIKIKLIQENINGGFDPVCKPYIYDSVKGESTGVSWAAGSKSERVETGIAICEAIKESLGLPDLPYLFDEGGEISADTFATRLKTEAQLVCVKVRDGIDRPTVLPL